MISSIWNFSGTAHTKRQAEEWEYLLKFIEDLEAIPMFFTLYLSMLFLSWAVCTDLKREKNELGYLGTAISVSAEMCECICDIQSRLCFSLESFKVLCPPLNQNTNPLKVIQLSHWFLFVSHELSDFWPQIKETAW